MTPEQQLEKLLDRLSELTRYEEVNYSWGDSMEKDDNGNYVLWQDIEAILKQTFPDDEFH